MHTERNPDSTPTKFQTDQKGISVLKNYLKSMQNDMLTVCSQNSKWDKLQEIAFDPNYNIYSTFVL